MPIRNIRILAGDNVNEYSPRYGSYPTYRKPGTCKDAATASNFNEVEKMGCADGPFTFTALYDCPGSDAYGTDEHCDEQATQTGDGDASHRWNTNWFHHGCWDPTFTHADDDGNTLLGACVFRPRVQVQDNWGYCTNAPGKTCTLGLGGDLCYDASPSTNECTYSESWVPFAGRIVVTPP